MRVLIVPELYRPDDRSANGTLEDAATWVRQWLDIDPTLHVYWLLPPEEGSDPSTVSADRERVTPVEADPAFDGGAYEELFTESGYSPEQLGALRDAIFDRDAYVDVAVDQLRTGRSALYKWLLEHSDHWAAQVRPFDVIANVHDLQLPFKHRYCSYRNEFQWRMEAARAVFADGIWFKAGVDARHLRERATEFLRPELVGEALDAAVETGSPIDFSAYEESYREAPRYLHLAGSFWSKKRVDRLFAAAETLFERHGVRTILTSVEEIPDGYRRPDWVEAYPEADRETFERALRAGDLAICASEYETMARTPFEQAASGQVLVIRDEPWIDDCVPDDYPLTGDPDELESLAAAAVENWADAVAANRRLVEHVERVRSPERAGRRTHADLRRRVDAKTAAYDLDESAAPVVRALDSLTGSDAERRPTDGGAAGVALDDLIERTAAFTDDGAPITDRESFAFSDALYALRSLGYVDAGNPGTPVFRPAAAVRDGGE